MSGKDTTNNRSEEELVLQVLRFYNGSWLTSHEILKEIKQLDRRFSARAVMEALAKLAVAGDILRQYRHQLVLYGVQDGTRPTRLYPSQPVSRPGVRRDDQEPRHEEVIPFEPWEE